MAVMRSLRLLEHDVGCCDVCDAIADTVAVEVCDDCAHACAVLAVELAEFGRAPARRRGLVIVGLALAAWALWLAPLAAWLLLHRLL